MADEWLEQPFSLAHKRIWVAGHNGLVGSGILRVLSELQCNILTVGRDDLDLRDQKATLDWMQIHKPEVVVLAAAHVGGILANQNFPADFLYNNLMIEGNVIHGAYQAGVKKLLFLGSSCIYPKDGENPIHETALLSGPLEPTNEFYAVAKIAGVKMCQAYRRQYGCDFISAMPCNLYGPGDRFDEKNSHVIPALMMRLNEASQNGDEVFPVWGSGKPKREFLHVNDLARALVFLLERYSSEKLINVGAGSEISIEALVSCLVDISGFDGRVVYDRSMPDGVARKLMDSSRIASGGWKPEIDLREGLKQTYQWYKRIVAH